MLFFSVKRVLSGLIDGKVWIAGATPLLAAASYRIFGLPLNPFLLAFLFAGTLSVYGLHAIARKRGRVLLSEKIPIAAGIFALGLALLLPVRLIPAMALTGLLALAYSHSVLPGKKRLRDFPLIKIFLIAGVWTYLSVFFPAWEADVPLVTSWWSFAAERALFIFALTLPFDIRDMQSDREEGVLTFPIYLGIFKTKQLAFFALLLSQGLTTFHLGIGLYTFELWLGQGVCSILTAILVAGSHSDRHPWYYTGLLDGMLVIQPTILLLITAF
ncbi:MAG: UbiA family prenyltransferase [Saprospiraceae bacterium]|nr:UbiA family prenyltransferase [Saprospiraceae bacterium]